LTAIVVRQIAVTDSSRGKRERSTIVFVIGCAMIAYLVWRADPRQVWRALEQARPWLPALAALEAVMLALDTAAYAGLIAPHGRDISARGWQRSAAASYVCLVLLPAGRALGEAARAVQAAPYVGVQRAAAAGAELQASSLLADGAISGVAAGVIFATLGDAQHLALALAGNCILVMCCGAALAIALRSSGVRVLLTRRLPSIVKFLPEPSPPASGSRRGAVLWSLLGRSVQVVQYGVAVAAVGGVFSVESMFVAHGVHTIAATAGVAVPNQMGVADGAYLVFAKALGFGNAPARALAVMLAVRVAQLILVLVCLVLLAVVRQTRNKGDVS
jgi:uncharacterized membrane protein YbhN (UPF0104 family)